MYEEWGPWYMRQEIRELNELHKDYEEKEEDDNVEEKNQQD